MTKQEFTNGMMIIAAAYPKFDATAVVLDIWYQFFADLSNTIFIDAVKNHIKKSRYPPLINDLLGACEDVKTDFRNGTLELMWEDGYFHKDFMDMGIVIDESEATRRYEKAVLWVSRQSIPSWFVVDYEAYKRRYFGAKIELEKKLLE